MFTFYKVRAIIIALLFFFGGVTMKAFKFRNELCAAEWETYLENTGEHNRHTMELATNLALEMEDMISKGCKNFAIVENEVAEKFAKGLPYSMYLTAKAYLKYFWFYGELL